MAGTGYDALLSGEGLPVELGRVEDELESLWAPVAQRAGGPELDHPTITRVSLANLVVACLDDTFDRTLSQLDQLATRYPCRVILLRQAGADSPRGVSAEITARCHLPAPGMPQVCAEQIILSAGTNGLDLFPGAVRPLLEGGLPVVLWWCSDPRPPAALALLETLAPEATRIVIDLPDPEADREALGTALALERHPYTRDLAWFGITRWREFVAQFFDPPGMSETLKEIRSVSVRVIAPAAVVRPPRVGAWLIAWLAGQLGWKPRGRPAFTGDCLTASFESESARIDIRMEVAVDSRTRLCRISAIELHSDPTSDANARVTGPDQRSEATSPCVFKVSRSAEAADEVLLEACRGESRALPRTLRAPEFDTAHRLAAALESAREDPPYRDALPIALWLLAPT